jgi:hypothetical protein
LIKAAHRIFIASLALAGGSAVGAAPLDVNFDSVTPFAAAVSSLSFDTQGYKFQTSVTQNGHGVYDGATPSAYGAQNGSNILVYFAANNLSETFSSVSNGAFDVTSLDIGGWLGFDNAPVPTLIKLTGRKFGSTATVSFDATVSPNTFTTFDLTQNGFTNLQSFELGGYKGSASGLDVTGYIAVDHILVTAVPEPETIAMLLAGLGVLGFVARPRKA